MENVENSNDNLLTVSKVEAELAMNVYAKQEAIAFSEFISTNKFKKVAQGNGLNTNTVYKKGGNFFTDAELYEEYLKSKNNG